MDVDPTKPPPPAEPPAEPPAPNPFIVERAVPPHHWRSMLVHETERVIHIELNEVLFYFRDVKLIGQGLYGKVFSVRLVSPSTSPAFAGLSDIKTYALKLEVLDYEAATYANPAHPSVLVELEVCTALRRFGTDMMHFVPLLAWTRWQFGAVQDTADAHNPFAIFANKEVQLLLFPYVTGVTLDHLYDSDGASARPSAALRKQLPTKPSGIRVLMAAAGVATQLFCALHLARSAGLIELAHNDLHPQNIMCSQLEELGQVEMLIYLFPDNTGYLLPLMLTNGRVLRILDMGVANGSYRYIKHKGDGSRPVRTHTFVVPIQDLEGGLDVYAVMRNATRLISEGETDQIRADVAVSPDVLQFREVVQPFRKHRLAGYPAESPLAAQLVDVNFYATIMRQVELCRTFFFSNQDDLRKVASKISELAYGAGSSRYARALDQRQYRIINMSNSAEPPVLSEYIRGCVAPPRK